MATPPHSAFRRIAWNGVAVVLPSSWQAKVTALQHLNFEKNSAAVMELRWQITDSKNVPKFIHTLTKQYQELTGRKLIPANIPSDCTELFEDYETNCFKRKKEGLPILIFLFSPSASLFIMLQFHHVENTTHPLLEIQSIGISKQDDSFSLWSIQDFQVNIPATFQLDKYTMKAGLTVLQFSQGKTVLNICRLALADKRLKQQSLEEIFFSLLGEENYQKPHYLSTASIRYQNSPGLLNQLGLRLKKKKPFRLAAFWQDQDNDRLLGVFMEDIKPMVEEDLEKICAGYEII